MVRMVIIIYWLAGKDLGGFVLMSQLQEHELCNGRVKGKTLTFVTLLHFLHIRFNSCRSRNGEKLEQISTSAAAEGCGSGSLCEGLEEEERDLLQVVPVPQLSAGPQSQAGRGWLMPSLTMASRCWSSDDMWDHSIIDCWHLDTVRW